MEHSFDIEVAKKYGVQSAILLKHLYFWIAKNKANNINFYDDYYWTYNSKKAFAELFPYMTARQIEYALQKLIDDGLVITGNYNKVAYDRTLWYAITKKGYSILQNCEMEETKSVNGNPENVEPIPNSKPNPKPHIKNKDNKKKREKKPFIPPTLEEVEEFCKGRNSSVDPKQFFDFFDVADWVDSKGKKVNNWKQKLITWERYSTDKESNNNGQNGGNVPKANGTEWNGFFSGGLNL